MRLGLSAAFAALVIAVCAACGTGGTAAPANTGAGATAGDTGATVADTGAAGADTGASSADTGATSSAPATSEQGTAGESSAAPETGGGGQTGPEVPPDAVALVAGMPVSRGEFDALVAQQKRAAQAQGKQFPAEGTDAYRYAVNQVLIELIHRVEFAHEAELRGITVTSEDVSKRIAQLVEKQFDGNRAKYERSIKQNGATIAQARAEIRAQLVYQKLADAVTKSVTVSDAEVKAAYEQRKDRFQRTRSRKIGLLLLRTKAEADAAAQKLRAGTSFESLVKSSSLSGGGTYTDKDGDFPAPIEDVAFALATGGVGEVQTGGIWYVITALGDVAAGGTIPFSQVAEKLRKELLVDKRGGAATTWFTELEKRYDPQIVYAPGLGPQSGADGQTNP